VAAFRTGATVNIQRVTINGGQGNQNDMQNLLARMAAVGV
jgi:hypothetical protein